MRIFEPLIEMLDDIGLPAFIANAQGSILAANREVLSTLRVLSTPATYASLALSAEQPRLKLQWEAGTATGQKFKAAFLEAYGARQWTLHVTPVSTEGEKWLAVLQRCGSAPIDVGEGLAESSAAGLRSALKAGSMALWEWQPHSDKAFWSPRVYDFLELPRGDGNEKGARFVSFIHPDDRPMMEGLLRRVIETGDIEPHKFRITTANGAVRWLISCAHAHRDPDGEVRLVTGVNIDVTAQEQVQATLEAAWKAADQRAGMLQAVMEHVPIGIAISLDEGSEVNLISKAGTDMIGKSEEDSRAWDAWTVYHLDGVTPARKEEMALHRALQGKIIRDEEWLIRKADGELLPVQCHAGPVFDKEGTLLGGVVAWYDVTPFKQAQAQRLQALDVEKAARQEAEKASEAKDFFLATLSHELRTPLSAMLTWAEVLLSDKVDGASMRRGLEAIRRNANVQARLMDDLLDVSRIIAGKLEVLLTPTDLGDAAALAIETVRGMADSKSVQLNADTTGQLLVLGDAVRLQQVAWNLISNAIKFSPNGSAISVTAKREGSWAVLKVQDQGQGIPPEMLHAVFERFKQLGAPSPSRRTGLGLGLAISHHIVERHNGTIQAESAGLDQGSTFTVRIPLM